MSKSASPIALVVKRVFSVNPDVLFDAWTQPALMMKWFHAKDSWTTPKAESDLRVGGAWSIEMKTEDGRVFRPFGVYKSIDKPSRLVFTWHPYGDADYETVVTLRFRKLAENSTELTLIHEGLRSDADRSDHESGWAGCLGNLGTSIVAERPIRS